MSTNKISKVQLNDELYLLKGDATNIQNVMLPIVDNIYSKINTGTDTATIQQILESLASLQNDKADRTELASIQSQIDYLSGQLPNGVINYYFIYKLSSQTPNRPRNDEEYVPSGWSAEPMIPDNGNVVYMSMARKVNKEWFNWGTPPNDYRWTLPIAYSDKSSLTLNIECSIALYKLSQGTPTLSDLERQTPAYPTGWSTTPDFAAQGTKEVYMITAKTLNGDYVDIGGYYWSAPMRIGNGTTSGTGADGDSYNYVYYPSDSSTIPNTPNFTVAEIEENQHIGNWYDRPQGVSANRMYEYISLSVGNDDNRRGWTTPVLWSKWGERGMDGDAVEYIYKVNDTGITPTIPSYNTESAAYQQDDYVPNGWTDNPTGVTENTPYEYVAIRKKKKEVWQSFENPVLWAKYGKDGEAGVVDGYLMTCNNSNVIADDNLFTKDNALDRFNALASATFKLTKTSGESITPQYALANDSVLPAGISAVSTFANSGVLTYTGSFTNAANIKDGDVYYAHVNGLVNGEVVATIKQTIYVKNFSQGESYRLIVTPTAIEVSSNNKFKSTASINVKFLAIGDVLSTDVDFNRYQLKYKVEKNGNSSTLVGNEWTSQNCTLGNANDTASNYYVVNLYKTVNSADVLVDSLTVNTYKNGEQGILGISGSVLRYRGIWNDLVTNNTSTLTFECNTPEGANITYIDVVSKQVEGGLEYYQCLKRHVLNLEVTTPDLNNSEYWQRAQLFDFIITKTLISDYISATTISADDVVITEKNDQGVITKIVAGMTSSHSNRDELEGADLGSVRIWAGTEGTSNLNVLEAPFRVTQIGELTSSKANIQGNIMAQAFSVVNLGNTIFKITTYGQLCLEFPDDSVLLSKASEYDDLTPLIFILDITGTNKYYIDLTKLTNGNTYTSIGLFRYPSSPSNLVGTDNQLVTGTNCYVKSGVHYVLENGNYIPITNTIIAQPINNTGSSYVINLYREGEESFSWTYHVFLLKYLDNRGIETQRKYIFVGPNVYINANDKLVQNIRELRFINESVIVSEVSNSMYPGQLYFSADEYVPLDDSLILLVPYEMRGEVIKSVYLSPYKAMWASYNELHDLGVAVDFNAPNPGTID